MAQKKTYVLVQQSVCPCGVDTHVWTYQRKKDAQNVLNILYQADKLEIKPEDRICEKTKDSYQIYEKDNYLLNNLTARIFATIPDSNEHHSVSICF